jgi:hypothetical protein
MIMLNTEQLYSLNRIKMSSEFHKKECKGLNSFEVLTTV